MTFFDLAAQIKSLPPEEVRTDSTELFECVFDTKISEKLTSVLEGFFGTVLKPAGRDPIKGWQTCAAEFGGIRRNQTFYYTERAGVFYCALIWPWEDGTRATLKVFPTKTNISLSTGVSSSPWQKITENIRSIFSRR